MELGPAGGGRRARRAVVPLPSVGLASCTRKWTRMVDSLARRPPPLPSWTPLHQNQVLRPPRVSSPAASCSLEPCTLVLMGPAPVPPSAPPPPPSHRHLQTQQESPHGVLHRGSLLLLSG